LNETIGHHFLILFKGRVERGCLYIWIRMKERIIPYMKKRTAVIAALVSLMPMGQSLVIGTGATLTSATLILSVPNKVQAETAVFYYNRGVDKSDVGDYKGALFDYNKAIEMNPEFVDAYYNRGTLKGRYLKDYYGAISDFNRAIELDPSRLDIREVYNNRGMTKLVGFSDRKGACKDFKKAVSLGHTKRAKWLNGNGGNWCRNMQ